MIFDIFEESLKENKYVKMYQKHGLGVSGKEQKGEKGLDEAVNTFQIRHLKAKQIPRNGFKYKASGSIGVKRHRMFEGDMFHDVNASKDLPSERLKHLNTKIDNLNDKEVNIRRRAF